MESGVYLLENWIANMNYFEFFCTRDSSTLPHLFSWPLIFISINSWIIFYTLVIIQYYFVPQIFPVLVTGSSFSGLCPFNKAHSLFLFGISYILALQDAPGLPFIFIFCPSPRTSHFSKEDFYRKMALETKIWALDVLIAIKSLFLGPFKLTEEENMWPGDPCSQNQNQTFTSTSRKKNIYVYIVCLFHIHLAL